MPGIADIVGSLRCARSRSCREWQPRLHNTSASFAMTSSGTPTESCGALDRLLLWDGAASASPRTSEEGRFAPSRSTLYLKVSRPSTRARLGLRSAPFTAANRSTSRAIAPRIEAELAGSAADCDECTEMAAAAGRIGSARRRDVPALAYWAAAAGAPRTSLLPSETEVGGADASSSRRLRSRRTSRPLTRCVRSTSPPRNLDFSISSRCGCRCAPAEANVGASAISG